MENIGKIAKIKDLERVIGIISYARRTIKKTEEVLAPLRQDLKILKKGNVSEQYGDLGSFLVLYDTSTLVQYLVHYSACST